ncbi:DUF2809 domain-containing protein [Flavobacterium sp.]|uniref:ribosomal maturation YjgA family protein n=1 Tax=Flavobacterium sp. TaxID=239 RepID=UPI003D6AD47A
MKNKRFRYFVVVLLLIIVGILSRKTKYIPLFFGDLLYAVMIYFALRIFLLRLSNLKIAFISLSLCYLIELSQLYQDIWINKIRNSFLGHYVLGEGFLWSDLIAYTFGVLFAFWIDKKKEI